MIRHISLIIAVFLLCAGPGTATELKENMHAPGINKISSEKSPPFGPGSWFDITSKSVQIIFWIILGTIAVLTYRSARKTILQPLRTEIFKLQLEVMKEVLGLFVGKGEGDLKNTFGLDELFHANVNKMYDEYALTLFDYEVEENETPYSSEKCPIQVITLDGCNKLGIRIADDHIRKDQIEEPSTIEGDVHSRVTLWANYDCPIIYVPKPFFDTEKSIKNLLENPMLPIKCVELLENYVSVARENIEVVRKILIEGAKEMPEKYSSMEDLQKSSFHWLRNQYAQKSTKLKPNADEIIAFVRKQYDVDNLLKR